MYPNIEEKVEPAIHRVQDTDLALDHINHVQGGLIHYGHYAEIGDRGTPVIHTFDWGTSLIDGSAQPSIYLSRALFVRPNIPSKDIRTKSSAQQYANAIIGKQFLDQIVLGQSFLVRHIKSIHPQGITYIGEPVINFMPWDHAYDKEGQHLVTRFIKKGKKTFISNIPILNLTPPRPGFEETGIGYVYNRNWQSDHWFYLSVIVKDTTPQQLGNYIPFVEVIKWEKQYAVAKISNKE